LTREKLGFLGLGKRERNDDAQVLVTRPWWYQAGRVDLVEGRSIFWLASWEVPTGHAEATDIWKVVVNICVWALIQMYGTATIDPSRA
jgi:hypothetical protein